VRRLRDPEAPLIEVRASALHGLGVFAAQRIRKGTRVIEAGVGGNAARFVNHACQPNCESVIEDHRVFIEAVRTIEPGEELTYDYQIQREVDDPPDVDAIFACRCGSARCRGSMLWPARRLEARGRTAARSRTARR